jgi:hypothetical protein
MLLVRMTCGVRALISLSTILARVVGGFRTLLMAIVPGRVSRRITALGILLRVPKAGIGVLLITC